MSRACWELDTYVYTSIAACDFATLQSSKLASLPLLFAPIVGCLLHHQYITGRKSYFSFQSPLLLVANTVHQQCLMLALTGNESLRCMFSVRSTANPVVLLCSCRVFNVLPVISHEAAEMTCLRSKMHAFCNVTR